MGVSFVPWVVEIYQMCETSPIPPLFASNISEMVVCDFVPHLATLLPYCALLEGTGYIVWGWVLTFE